MDPAGAVKKGQSSCDKSDSLAIAIGYEKEIDAAPYILAMGTRQNGREHS